MHIDMQENLEQETQEYDVKKPIPEIAVVLFLILALLVSLSLILSYLTRNIAKNLPWTEENVFMTDSETLQELLPKENVPQINNEEWLRYEDEELGYSFRYPDTWSAQKTQPQNGLYWTWVGPNPDDLRLSIEGLNKPGHLSLEEVITQANAPYYQSNNIQVEKLLSDSGEPYYRMSGFNDSFVPYVLYYIGNERQVIVVRSLLNQIDFGAATTDDVLGDEIPESPTRLKIISSIIVE